MGSTRFYLVLTLFACARLDAQAPSGLEDAIRIGPGVTPPRLLRKAEPEYSPDARADRIQGTVVLELAVNEKGRAVGIAVISPLGFGLDERAQAAVEKWEFAPGLKDGKPVKILAIVEVNFRFPELWFDEKAERQRTAFNEAVQTLRHSDASAKAIERTVKSLQDLSKLGFPPAMHLVGVWEISGDHISKDPNDGLMLVQRAAAKNYGPALYEIAIRQIEGRDVTKDGAKGLETMRQASVLGSQQAQFYLGNLYETGSGVSREPDRARRYFRLCAARGVPLCQLRLGTLLLTAAERPERDYVQGVAWLQLASENGVPEAKDIAVKEAAKLTAAQTTWMTSLKAQLVPK